jgi:hypothetical protein
MKAIVLLSVTLILLVIFSGGCRSGSKATVTFDELIAKPEQYNGKTVTVDGIYVNGWEWTILAGNIAFIGNGDSKELTVADNAIWFAGFLPQDVRDRLYQYTSPGAGPQHYGKVRVTGIFESGGKYGNIDAYKFRITASRVEILDWTPPK